MISKNTPLVEVMKDCKPCACRACEHGCLHGSGVLTKEDVPKLAKHLGITEERLKEKHLEEVEKFNTKLFRPKVLRKDGKPFGKCSFYDEELKCTIHNAKPTECKVSMGCGEHGEELSVWFTLNTFLNENDPESVRQYASYLKVGGKTLPGGELHAIIKDEKTLKKILSYEILR